jgi:hypothetical protein
MDRAPILFLTMVIVMGAYVLPSVTARFAGSHTMELNHTEGVEGSGTLNLKCANCHTYIDDELNATANADMVITAHLNAAANTNFTGPNGEINLTSNLDPNDASRACKMCHVLSQNSVNIAGSHTKVAIRPCTVCHGNSTDTGLAYSDFGTAGDMGRKLANSTDGHRNFFVPLDTTTSDLGNLDASGNYSNGYFACLACHTHVGVNFRFERPNSYDLNLTYDGTWTGSKAANNSATNVTIRSRSPGSVWQ